MKYDCKDFCCMYGVDVDLTHYELLSQHLDEIRKFMNLSEPQFFTDDFIEDSECPGGRYTRTLRTNGHCIFLDESDRGCAIHKYCLTLGLEYNLLKPMASCLFPVTFQDQTLIPSMEATEGKLPCIDHGRSLFEGVKSDLKYYFGEELVRELEQIQQEITN
jgi:hypothetical protein